MSEEPTAPDPTSSEATGSEATAAQPAAPDPSQLALVFHRVRGIGQRMETLAERLEQVEQRAIPAGSTRDDAEPAQAALPEWSWVGLDPAERGARLQELHQWVTWLVETYEVPTGQLPNCWYRHGSMTADLTALRAGWTAAYLDPEAEPDRPSRWHDTLERTLRRIREWDRHGCGRSGSHTDTVDGELDYTDARLFAQYVARQTERVLSHPEITVPGTI